MAGVTGGMSDVDLEVGGQAVRVVAAGKQPLLVDLPFELNADVTKAKVSRRGYGGNGTSIYSCSLQLPKYYPPGLCTTNTAPIRTSPTPRPNTPPLTPLAVLQEEG